MKKNIIWSNTNLDIADWKENYKEFLEINEIDHDPNDENDIYDWMVETNDEYLDAERMSLNVSTEGRIVAIANLGFWNGRKMGYKLLDHNNKDCLQFEKDCDYAEFYCDRYDLHSTQHHHDGSHYITYREFRPNITSDQADNFCWKLYNGKITQKDITRYTRSLRPYVNKVYGWR